MALLVEVIYESSAAVRADWEAQLKAGRITVPGRFADDPGPFADVMLILIAAGAEAARVPAIVTATSDEATCVEIVPESRAFLASQLAALVDAGAAGGSTDRKQVRLFDDEKEKPWPAGEDDFDDAPTGKLRPGPASADAQPIDKRIAALSMGEKIRLAMHGTRDERVFLAKERPGAVQASLVRNPRVTIDELLALARAPHLAPEAAEAMLQHPSYGSSPQIAVALVRNPRTPIPLAVELVAKLQPHDLRVIAKGLNVRMPIAQAARKRLVNSG